MKAPLKYPITKISIHLSADSIENSQYPYLIGQRKKLLLQADKNDSRFLSSVKAVVFRYKKIGERLQKEKKKKKEGPGTGGH